MSADLVPEPSPRPEASGPMRFPAPPDPDVTEAERRRWSTWSRATS
jgi:hypothetical protein